MSKHVIFIETTLAKMIHSIEKENSYKEQYNYNDFIKLLEESITKKYKYLSIEKYLNNENVMKKMWNNYFLEAKINKTSLIYCDISFFTKLTFVLSYLDLSILKNIIKYSILKELGNGLFTEYDNIMKNIYEETGKNISLTEKEKISKYFIDKPIIADVIGNKYIDLHYNYEKNIYLLNFIINIKEQAKRMLYNSKWLSEKAKYNGSLKIDNLKISICNPDWKIYYPKFIKKLNILLNSDELSLINIICEINKLTYKKNILENIDMPINIKKKSSSSYTLGIYYDMWKNEIVIPLGILNYPIFNINQTIVEMHGNLGVIIGHEIIHAIDESGKNFDKDGNFNPWWSKTDINNYNIYSNEMIKQVSNYKLNNQTINARYTLDENIADLGGVILSYNTLLSFCKKKMFY
jgi:putative endopeptidase